MEQELRNQKKKKKKNPGAYMKKFTKSKHAKKLKTEKS